MEHGKDNMKGTTVKRIAFALLLVMITAAPIDAKRMFPEKHYQQIWCAKNGGITEVVMKSGKRCDCETSALSVEFDFADKWAEALGQALHYASQTKKTPGIVLICESKKGLCDVEMLRKTLAYWEEKHGLKVMLFVVEAWE